METEPHYFRVGMYIIVLTVVAALFALWLASDGIDNSEDYRIYFGESVSGLSEGSAVKYRGVTVGQVKNISIDTKDPRLIRVTVTIGEDTPVKVGTVAGLKLQGITGAVFIELSGSAPQAQSLADAFPNRKIQIIPSEASSITTIMTQLPQIMDKLSRFADQLAKISTDENIAAFNAALHNIAAMADEGRQVIRDSKGNIIDATEQMSGTMSNLRKASRDINNVTDRIEENPSSLIFPPDEQGIPAP